MSFLNNIVGSYDIQSSDQQQSQLSEEQFAYLLVSMRINELEKAVNNYNSCLLSHVNKLDPLILLQLNLNVRRIASELSAPLKFHDLTSLSVALTASTDQLANDSGIHDVSDSSHNSTLGSTTIVSKDTVVDSLLPSSSVSGKAAINKRLNDTSNSTNYSINSLLDYSSTSTSTHNVALPYTDAKPPCRKATRVPIVFKCDFCAKEFYKKWRFENHRRTHTGEKPFVCPHENCHSAFADRSNLRAHIKTHGEKNNICSRCGRSFTLRSYYNKHQRTSACERTLARQNLLVEQKSSEKSCVVDDQTEAKVEHGENTVNAGPETSNISDTEVFTSNQLNTLCYSAATQKIMSLCLN